MNKNFAMTVLRTVSHPLAEASPPPLCEYNEQAAAVRTPSQDKNIDAPDAIRAACLPKSARSLYRRCENTALAWARQLPNFSFLSNIGRIQALPSRGSRVNVGEV
jgi:hypothetical protein